MIILRYNFLNQYTIIVIYYITLIILYIYTRIKFSTLMRHILESFDRDQIIVYIYIYMRKIFRDDR